MAKIRCPLRPASMTLDRDRPEIITPPGNPQACCTQQTLTVPPEVNAKTRQKHDYPSTAWRRSYARRTGAERGFATAKDPATNDSSRGWSRLMGPAPLMLFTTALLIARNQLLPQLSLNALYQFNGLGQQLDSAEAPPAVPTWEQVAAVIDGDVEKAVKGAQPTKDAVSDMQSQAQSIGTGL